VLADGVPRAPPSLIAASDDDWDNYVTLRFLAIQGSLTGIAG
jgi:hypothetical protein